MKHTGSRSPASVFRQACSFWRRIVSGKTGGVQNHDDRPRAYVGLFQGVLETTAQPSASVLPTSIPLAGRAPGSHPPARRPAANAAGFVRLEVDQQKKATGCLMLFVDGQVLTGAVEGASERTRCFAAAHCRLDRSSAHGQREGRPVPFAAVGRLQLQGRVALPTAAGESAGGEGEEVTIRFV